MQINVKFFASLSEAVGMESVSVVASEGATIRDIWRLATERSTLDAGTLCARNLEYAEPETVLCNGDEVAFFPPVTGGAGPTILVSAEPFDPWACVGAHESGRSAEAVAADGAAQVFVGRMRAFNEGEGVSGMTLQHYPGMTEKHLKAIADEAMARFPIRDVLVRHRIGDLHPGDAIVLVAVWSQHRAAAFEACRFVMEDLKSRAPFWKREQTEQGARWVSGNTAGYLPETEQHA